MPDRLDRDTLIEAVLGAPSSYDCGQCSNCRDEASAVLSRVLPLIADAIEAQERLPYAMQRYVRIADARLVRSLLPQEDQ